MLHNLASQTFKVPLIMLGIFSHESVTLPIHSKSKAAFSNQKFSRSFHFPDSRPMERTWTAMDVFKFEKDDFCFSEKFASSLEESENPLVITFIGNSRDGKSTRLNQIITKQLKTDKPFDVDPGPDPVAKSFQAVGPISIQDLSEIHRIDLHCSSRPDIFLVDCEGLHSLSETSSGVKKATFALAQISNIVVLVTKAQLSFENFNSVWSLFALSRAFNGEDQGFPRGTVILQRDVGVRKIPSLKDQESARQTADRDWCEKCRALLSQKNLHFVGDELKVLCQPTFDQPELYWNSICDVIRYMCTIADRRDKTSARNLTDIFNSTKPHIMKVQDFEKPDIPFEKIFKDVADQYLNEASNYAMEFSEKLVSEPISRLSEEELKLWPDISLIDEAKIAIVKLFKDKMTQMHSRILEYYPGGGEICERSLKESVDVTAREQVDIVCWGILCQKSKAIFGEVELAVRAEIESISDSEVNSFSFSGLTASSQKKAEELLLREASYLSPRLSDRGEFRGYLSELKGDVEKLIALVEEEKKGKYDEFRKAENAKAIADMTNQSELRYARLMERTRVMHKKHMKRIGQSRQHCIRICSPPPPAPKRGPCLLF
jgi:hypothetical protein